jgi:hypothetical protein|tara:strand:- start:154 stop:1221 length:1068 start_codon:yes stop_codon:yes gene_type:complete
MVTAQTGLLTSVNTGSYANTGGTGDRVLIDYKDAIVGYETTNLPALSMFTERMQTDTGGRIDITFNLPSMTMEQIDEGSTPQYQHTKLRSERVDVKEWGIAVGVTRRMIEDSRFNEVEMALNEARKAVDRHLTKHVIYALFGIANTTFGTGVDGASISGATTEANIVDFSDNIYGGFQGSGGTVGSGRLYNYGVVSDTDLQKSHYTTAASTSGILSLSDLTNAIELIGQHGYNADSVLISPAHYKSLLDMADFQSTISAVTGGQHVVEETSPFRGTLGTGLVGSLFGLNVYTNAWCPSDRFGIFDLAVKPMAFVERRGLTVEEANPGFGIVGSYLSMRYGLKILHPETGVICLNQ